MAQLEWRLPELVEVYSDARDALRALPDQTIWAAVKSGDASAQVGCGCGCSCSESIVVLWLPGVMSHGRYDPEPCSYVAVTLRSFSLVLAVGSTAGHC